jgi:hypothetical protein
MSKIPEYIAWFLFLVPISGDTGFKFVQILVKIVRWFDMGILDPGYIKLWLPLIILAAVAMIPLFGIWIELRRWRKANEKPRYPIDDKYDEMVR